MLQPGEWSADEHQHFLEAFAKFPKNWEKITNYVGRLWEC